MVRNLNLLAKETFIVQENAIINQLWNVQEVGNPQSRRSEGFSTVKDFLTVQRVRIAYLLMSPKPFSVTY